MREWASVPDHPAFARFRQRLGGGTGGRRGGGCKCFQCVQHCHVCTVSLSLLCIEPMYKLVGACIHVLFVMMLVLKNLATRVRREERCRAHARIPWCCNTLHVFLQQISTSVCKIANFITFTSTISIIQIQIIVKLS